MQVTHETAGNEHLYIYTYVESSFLSTPRLVCLSLALALRHAHIHWNSGAWSFISALSDCRTFRIRLFIWLSTWIIMLLHRYWRLAPTVLVHLTRPFAIRWFLFPVASMYIVQVKGNYLPGSLNQLYALLANSWQK